MWDARISYFWHIDLRQSQIQKTISYSFKTGGSSLDQVKVPFFIFMAEPAQNTAS